MHEFNLMIGSLCSVIGCAMMVAATGRETDYFMLGFGLFGATLGCVVAYL